MSETKRKAQRKVPVKLCVRCGDVLPLSDFYGNKGWATQSFHDAWCKECAAKFCVDKDSLREYCWYNNRRWTDEYYDMASKKARYNVANSEEYLKATKEKRAAVEAQSACRAFFSMMNLSNIYCYSDNVGKEGEYREFDAESDGGTINAEDQLSENGELIYDRAWNGMYTQREIDYLNDYYDRLEEGFVLDNQNIQDYARKAAKAS